MSVVEAAGSAVIDCSGLGSGGSKDRNAGSSKRERASEGEREREHMCRASAPDYVVPIDASL